LKKALAVAHVIHARKMCYSVLGSRMFLLAARTN
jgi:hypothetical protein